MKAFSLYIESSKLYNSCLVTYTCICILLPVEMLQNNNCFYFVSRYKYFLSTLFTFSLQMGKKELKEKVSMITCSFFYVIIASICAWLIQ